MTVSELYNSTAQLGFEASLEDTDRFFFAANRALLQVAAIRPAARTCVIHHRPMVNKVCANTFSPVEKLGDLCFEATGVRSYYFEADGRGTVILEMSDGGVWREIGHVDLEASRSFVAYRGFILKDGAPTDARVRLRFTGKYLYSVKNVAMYAHLYSDAVEDIPAYEPYTRYDVSAMVSDFLSLQAPPVMEAEGFVRLSDGYEIENGRVLLLPHESRGLYKIGYHHRPAVLKDSGDVAGDATVIDLDEDLCALLPLLVAAYVWAEDEPQKAEYYLTLYRERAVDVERRQRNLAPVAYVSVNGW